MPEHCSCGARLPEDARFCHRCGRPVGEPAIFESHADLPPVVSAPPPLPASAPPVSFGNPIALRIACMMAVGILIFPLFALVAGWGAVLLYRRLTGVSLDTRAGALLGSITGVVTFTGMAVVSAMTMAFAGKQYLDTLVRQDPNFAEVVKSPAMLVTMVFFVLIVVFCLVVTVCAAGGALGAKFVSRRPQH